jgi:hypothetical protein
MQKLQIHALYTRKMKVMKRGRFSEITNIYLTVRTGSIRRGHKGRGMVAMPPPKYHETKQKKNYNIICQAMIKIILFL